MAAMKVFSKKHLKHLQKGSKIFFWFVTGAILGLFFLVSFAFLLFEFSYRNTVYPGVFVDGVNFGGKTESQVAQYFARKNEKIADSTFTLTVTNFVATVSARQLQIGYNANLLAKQAMSIGRSTDTLSNISLIFQAYISGISLPPSYTYNPDVVAKIVQPIQQKIYIAPVNAVFTMQNNTVTAFKPSFNGQDINIAAVQSAIQEKTAFLLILGKPQHFTIVIPVQTLKPKITTGSANSLGITDLLGVGTSLFQGSIQSRVYNITLASSRVNNVLVKPGDVFSFDATVGDVSSFTGYKQAYVIQNGKTVLGDGGGVCQVSTTLFRAALNAGLPIVERHAHAYRVEYYEEDGPPGLDATVYVPTVDLKFKNDTGHYMLIQSVVDPVALRLTYYIYGTSDGRKTTLTTPIVSNSIPAPSPQYTDDPNLPAGTIQQTDFAANGATVTFSRTVTRGNKTLIAETYTSVYQPWQAQYLRGTGPN